MRNKLSCVLALAAIAGLPTMMGSATASPPEHDTHAKPSQPAAKPKADTRPAAKPESKSAAKSGKGAAKGESKHDTKPAKGSESHETPVDEHAGDQPEHGTPTTMSSTGDSHGETPARVGAASAGSTRGTGSLGAEGAIDAERALTLLLEGNARWVNNASQSPNTDSSRRADVAENGQTPFVTVLTCADSRLPVERLFDRGVGDVFVVRVAGNVAGDSETGTIEYGVGHLKTPLLVVMGHTKCGAVAAAASGAELHGKVGSLVANITPAVERAKRANPGLMGNELAAASVKENVWQTVYQLFKTSPECLEAVQGGKVKVVGAVCDISTGKVEWMGEHPWQSELIAAFAPQSGRGATASQDPPAAQGDHANPHADGGTTKTASHDETDGGH
ncbi:MAG: hypothetical protein JNL50_15145 [Phycisphaerae bacterium]|nr:hypothetical protein [Phycisphaerae bacterium]